MLAVKAKFENGSLKWLDKPPAINAEVMVVFSFENDKEKPQKKLSNEEAIRILNKYAGSIDREFDYEKERDEYFNEKYGTLN